MKSALVVSCGGPQSSWYKQRQVPQRGRVVRRWIAAALLLALGLAVVALLLADPVAADLALTVRLPYV
ncbi:hypothetical protein [Mycobacterium sp. 29Ha]|uniref:hypothetical protein n=1 Tax=Mycobacterium sp. 29Ha TaxID=2939268 RepID=UPI002938DE88|nr:hypothetical protein [Mycobacterium sp. 29Ha]MDV3131353.1 hypothetical protein [Mycobacterium sp. 29Ha]